MTSILAKVGAVVALVAALALPCAAHDRGTSYSTWTIRDGSVHISVRLTELDLSRFPWGTSASSERDRVLRDYLPTHLRLWRGGDVCALAEAAQPLRSAPGFVTYEWKLRCNGRGTYEIRSDLLAEVSPSHLHFARVRLDEAPATERVLSSRGATWEFGADDDTPAPAHGTDIAGYFGLGVEHILTGYDHLAFVLALLLLGGTIGEVAKIVTGFTVAHSITLGLMVLGYVRPEPAPIEALIGLSIALVAAENLWQTADNHGAVPLLTTILLGAMAVGAFAGFGSVPGITLVGLAIFTYCYFRMFAIVERPATLRWGIAFLFGLIHGFGFAAMLTEAGLPANRIFAALLGFNAGVEAGQLAVVAAVWPLLVALRRRDGVWRIAVVEVGSAAVLALGIYWFVTRTYG